MSETEVKAELEGVMARVDAMIERAERNGWNAAINAAREILPVEYSQQIRPLYKFTDEDGAQS